MLQIVRNLDMRVDVLLLQELHGNTAEILNQLSMWLPGFLVFGTACQDDYGKGRIASGGCAIVIRPEFALAPPQHLVMVPGRCHFVSFMTRGEVEVHIGNLHNFDIAKHQISTVGAHLKLISEWEAANPMHVFSFFGGDLNYDLPGRHRFVAGLPVEGGPERCMPSFVNGAVWDKYLKYWTEMVQPYPTCYTAASGSSARLDRCFFCGPAP